MTPHHDTTSPDGTDPIERWLDTRRGVLGKGAAASTALALGLPAAGTAAAGQDREAAATIEFGNQATDGRTVVVDSVELSEGGYVAVHDARLLDDQVVESVVGASEFLEAGTHAGLEIPLFDVPGAEFDRSRLEMDQPLVPMPHRETTGDQQYDFVASDGEDDGPYTLAGQPVLDVGFVRVVPVSTVEFRNQQTDGEAVTVESVTLSAGGFVTIHDATLFEGETLGSVVGVSGFLEPGTHEDVGVTLFEVPGGEFDRSRLEETQPLVAMPHLDTNGNQEYDFLRSDGAEDGPYVDDQQAVVDVGFAVVG